MDFEDHVDQDQTRRRRLQDVLPLEAQSAPDTEAATVCWTKETDKKSNALHEKNKDPTDVPRSRTYFQVLVLVYECSLFSSLFVLLLTDLDRFAYINY